MPLKVVSSYQPAGDQPKAIKKLVDGLKVGYEDQVLLGVTGSGKTFSISKVIEEVQRPTLVLSPNKTLAAQLFAEFRELFPEAAVEYFVSYYDYYQPEAYIPRTDTYIEKDSSKNEEIDRLRNRTTYSLLTRKDVIVVASVSCIYGIGSPENYLKGTATLRLSENVRRGEVIKRLVELQYERNDLEFVRARFRVRGEIVDVWPSPEEIPTRLQFLGDKLERIYDFDGLTGEILREREGFTIFPATHYVTPDEELKKAIKSIEQELRERLTELTEAGKILEASRLTQRTNFDLEMMRETGTCAGIENYSRHLSGRAPGERPFCLLDFLPKDSLIVVDESHVAIPQIQGMYNGDRARKVPLVEYGFRLPSAMDNRPLTFKEWSKVTGQIIYVSATPRDYELELSRQTVEQIIRPTGLPDPLVEVRPATGQIDDLLSEIHKTVERKNRVLITTLTKKMAEELTDYLIEAGVRARYLHSDIDTLERVEIIRDLRLGEFDVLVGINLLREGLDLPEVSFIGILDADKEGFLRGKRALIQTIGRAARNLEGKVILYADSTSRAMKEAMQETAKRRTLQVAFNKKHRITPKSISKAVYQLESHRAELQTEAMEIQLKAGMDVLELTKLAKDIEREMKKAATDMRFERAAELRDQLYVVREKVQESKK